jgi:hypothetical protein
MKKLIVALVSGFIVSVFLFLVFKNQLSSPIRNLSGVNDSGLNSILCKHYALLNTKSLDRVLLEERVISGAALDSVDQYGLKGVYFDLQRAGGFVIYSERGAYVVEVEGEEVGVMSKKKFTALPFSEKAEISIDRYQSSNGELDVAKFELKCEMSRTPHLVQ